VRRKLSLITFLWSYVRILCHMWPIMCRECDRQCVSQGQLSLALKHMFGMITQWSKTFSTKLSRLRVLLGNIRHHIAAVFTSVEQFVTRQAVKWGASSLWRHSTWHSWHVCNIHCDVRSSVVYCCRWMLNLMSIQPQLNEQCTILWALTLSAYTRFCAYKWNMCPYWGVFQQSYFISVCKITAVESQTSILVLFCAVIRSRKPRILP
jgi:hypothetical protein